MKTLVIGASTNPERYSNKAVKLLRAHNHEVIALGRDTGAIEDVKIETDFPADKDIDTVTMYVSPVHQAAYYQKIITAHPRRIIFNPGAENTDLKKLAEQNKIATEEACTLVLLNTGQF